MKTVTRLGLTAAAALLAGALQAEIFTGVDLGSPTLKGSATSNPDGTKTIVGGGSDIWGAADSGYYYYTTTSAPVWDAVVRVRDLVNNDDAGTGTIGDDGWTKCELMVRMPGDAGIPMNDDPFIAAMTTRSGGQNQVGPQWRTARAGNADWNAMGLTVRPSYPNTWLKIERREALFTILYSTDGTTWNKYVDIDTSKGDVVGADNSTTFGTPWPTTVYVGIAVTAHYDADPTGGIATISDLAITPITTPPNLRVLADVQDVTAIDGTAALFTFQATNTAIPNGYVTAYQWYRNGVEIKGATGSKLNINVAAIDNNAKITCKATFTGAAITSREATLTVTPGTAYNGFAKWEFWDGSSRAAVVAGNVGPADMIMTGTGFETAVNFSDTYTSRLSAQFVPPADGKYVFFIAADDDADLFLSTDSSPANKKLIAQEGGWSGSRNWITIGGAPSVNTQKRSDQFSPDGGYTYPGDGGYDLKAGQTYYIEAVAHEGGGGDNLAVTYTLYGELDPLDGDPPTLVGDVIRYSTWAVTKLEVATSPQDATVFEDQKAAFTATFATDGEAIPLLQWQRMAPGGATWENIGGVIAAAANTYSFTARLTDNGAKYKCIATLPAPGLTAETAVATLTVNEAMFITGLVKQEIWGPTASDTYSRAGVENGSAGDSTSVNYINAFATTDFADYYAQRLSGLFVPDVTGYYVFFVSSDDDCDLFISTDADPANKRLVAQETAWSGARMWNSSGGGSTVSQKRSDQWTPGDGTYPYADGIYLEKDKRYYIEGVHHEGNGGDNFAATYKLNTEEDPVDDSASKLVGARVGVMVPAPKNLEITVQPQDVTAHGWDRAVFTVDATAEAFYPPTFQWRRNGTAIPGATGKAFSLLTSKTDNGAKFDCVVSLAGYPTTLTTREAKLTVLGDAVFVAGSLKQERWEGSNRDNLNIGNVGAPASEALWTSFDGPNEAGVNFTRSVSGIFIPAETGHYVFFTCSDDDSDFFISTDDQPATKRLCAQQQGWSNQREWLTANGGSADMKRSDRWTPVAGQPAPYAEGIYLEKDKHYFIQGTMHEGSGGDNHSATFVLLGSEPLAGAATAFVSGVLGHYEAPVAEPLEFTSVKANADGTLTVTWIGGGTLQYTTSLTAPVTWVDATGATSPFTFTPPGNTLFGRLVR